MFAKKNNRIPKILLVQGSLSPYSKTAILVERAAYVLRNRSIPYDILDLCTANLDFYREGVTYGEETREALLRITACDGFVFCVPVYGGAVSGGIKNLIDIAQEVMHKKCAGIACYSAEGNSYQASVAFKELLMARSTLTTVQPILHTENDSFKNKLMYDDAAIDILEEMIDSLFLQMHKRLAGA